MRNCFSIRCGEGLHHVSYMLHVPGQVNFEPPELALPGLSLRIGPESSVVLTTSYLDETIRLGKGSRGSRFIFVRGGDADSAGDQTHSRSQVASTLIASYVPIMSIKYMRNDHYPSDVRSSADHCVCCWSQIVNICSTQQASLIFNPWAL